jgi:DNA-binding response OmpR family regulator
MEGGGMATEKPLRVLIVDDNQDAALGLALIMRAFGYQAQTVPDGLSAVPAALDYLPDVVLMDIGMPGMNGYDVACKFRQSDALKSAVLVAVTGWGSEDDRKRSVDAGFDHHLVKPADITKLREILESVARKST